MSQENYLHNAHLLIENWDNNVFQFIDDNASGLNNQSGYSHTSLATILTPSHPDFYSYIELEVRPLIHFFVEECKFITYSSCEGHATTELTPFQEMHVGVIPRDQGEKNLITRMLLQATKYILNQTISIEINPTILHTNGPEIKVIDIYFKSKSSEKTYFKNITHIRDNYIEIIRRIRDI